jgi:hypothetical protein
MALNLIAVTPENFDPDLHQLPTAGELLLAGAHVKIDFEGVAHPVTDGGHVDGIVIDASLQGDIVEVAVIGEQQEDGGFYFEQILVLIDQQ